MNLLILTSISLGTDIECNCLQIYILCKVQWSSRNVKLIQTSFKAFRAYTKWQKREKVLTDTPSEEVWLQGAGWKEYSERKVSSIYTIHQENDTSGEQVNEL